MSYSQPRPISHLGAALAWPYAGIAFNTGVGELDDLPANVGVGVCRGTDGAVDLLGIYEREHGRDPVRGAYRVPPSRLNSEVWRG